jgi:hypothetical protein
MADGKLILILSRTDRPCGGVQYEEMAYAWSTHSIILAAPFT